MFTSNVCLFAYTGPASAWGWTEQADWLALPDVDPINWLHHNPMLTTIPGSSRDNFYEDVMHEDGLGLRKRLCAGALVRTMFSCPIEPAPGEPAGHVC